MKEQIYLMPDDEDSKTDDVGGETPIDDDEEADA